MFVSQQKLGFVKQEARVVFAAKTARVGSAAYATNRRVASSFVVYVLRKDRRKGFGTNY